MRSGSNAQASSPDKFAGIGSKAGTVFASLSEHRTSAESVLDGVVPRPVERGPAKCAMDVLDDLKAKPAKKNFQAVA